MRFINRHNNLKDIITTFICLNCYLISTMIHCITGLFLIRNYCFCIFETNFLRKFICKQYPVTLCQTVNIYVQNFNNSMIIINDTLRIKLTL